ncbi:MAG: hypothetical protein JSV78_04390 [Phycisphaerales bacterium]|nr:MAG: hypothetical protein JSV78_04390 [Phycisphaerales bacterium]
MLSVRHVVTFAAVLAVAALAPATQASEGVSFKLGTLDSQTDYGILDQVEEETVTVTTSEPMGESGFWYGLPGYEDFVMPVGMPFYFEDPFITSDLRLIYLCHSISNNSPVGGGEVMVAAVQFRMALTDRLAVLITKDGYSWLNSDVFEDGDSDGWNDSAVGLKYAIYSDPDEQFLFTGGMRAEFQHGSRDALQGGGSSEISPFLSFAKGWDKLHFLGTLSGRFPTNRNKGNQSIVWNMHLDYALTETFYPLVEVHGIHWISNGDRVPVDTDYLDIGSFGSTDVSGRDAFSAGLGFRWEITENISLGTTFEIPLESKDQHMLKHRLTINTVISF